MSSFSLSELLPDLSPEPLPDLSPEPLPDLPPSPQGKDIMDNPFPDLEPEPPFPDLEPEPPFPDLEPEPLLPLLPFDFSHNQSWHISWHNCMTELVLFPDLPDDPFPDLPDDPFPNLEPEPLLPLVLIVLMDIRKSRSFISLGVENFKLETARKDERERS